MLGIVVLVDAVAVLFDLREYSLLGRIARRAGVTVAEAEASDPRQEAIGVLQLSVLMATAIAFIAWLHRAYSNVIGLGPRERAIERAGPSPDG